MKILRTSPERFANLKDFPFEPRHVEVGASIGDVAWVRERIEALDLRDIQEDAPGELVAATLALLDAS